jgi:serine/threonine protein kinase
MGSKVRRATSRLNPGFSATSPEMEPPPESIFPLHKSQYELVHQIGSSSERAEEVYVARCLKNQRQVAAKLTNLDLCDVDLDQFRRETGVWVLCSHPNLITYYASFVSDSILWCLCEYVDGGSLTDIMSFGYPSGFPDEIFIASVLQPVLQFLEYFHEHFQIHRRIRPENILLSLDGNVKVGDLASAASMVNDGQRLRARFTVMDSAYSAPEALTEGTGHTEKSDIWSLGMTTIALATGKSPYDHMDPLGQIQAIVTGPPPALTGPGHSPQIRDFVKQCLQMDPDLRPAASQLLKHSFIKKEKGRAQIRTITGHLPPLYERYEAINENLLQAVMDRASDASLPRRPTYSFDLSEMGLILSQPRPPSDEEPRSPRKFRVSSAFRDPEAPVDLPPLVRRKTLDPQFDAGQLSYDLPPLQNQMSEVGAQDLSSEVAAIRESNIELQDLVAEALVSVTAMRRRKSRAVDDV